MKYPSIIIAIVVIISLHLLKTMQEKSKQRKVLM